ncbi:hypothetical protein ACRQ1B_07345 [Rhizobium panacihumi]|uniref:hypothetical protein n=1 Tax=Rhizobium panacihumi TaxID=2008450 RepID=UPI003D79577F
MNSIDTQQPLTATHDSSITKSYRGNGVRQYQFHFKSHLFAKLHYFDISTSTSDLHGYLKRHKTARLPV